MHMGGGDQRVDTILGRWGRLSWGERALKSGRAAWRSSWSHDKLAANRQWVEGIALTTTRRVVQNRRARRQKLQTGFRLLMRRLLIVFLSIMGVLVLALLTGVGSALSAYGYYAQQLPDPESIKDVEQEFATVKLYDRTGTILLYEIVDPLGGDRTWVEMSDVPASFRDATVAIEDKTFYTNPGYDAEGIARALYNNITGGQVQGGSSITQQLVKNVLIEP